MSCSSLFLSLSFPQIQSQLLRLYGLHHGLHHVRLLFYSWYIMIYFVSAASEVVVSRKTSVPPASAANSSVDSEYTSGGEERDLPPRKKIKTVEEGIIGVF